MIKNLAVLFGIIFLLMGVLGFVPAFTPEHSDGMRYLLGIFMVGGVHNVVHLLSGALALWAGLSGSLKYASSYFQAFGVIYALIPLVGFIQKTTVFGLFAVNNADNWLHLVLAVVMLAIGFGVKAQAQAPPQATV